jgi:hypothetical protein
MFAKVMACHRFPRHLAIAAAIGVTLAAFPLHAQNASLSGSVLTDPGEKPLANAEVTFPELKLSTRSDAQGNFSLTGLAAGKQALIVRLVGYESFNAEITFTASQKVEADFLLKEVSTKLEKVDVSAKGGSLFNARLAAFEERRANPGGGRFFTSDIFEKARGSNVSDILLGRVPGLRRVNVQHTMVRPLAGRSTTKYNCYIAIIVNGLTVYTTSYGESFYDVDALSASDIIGAEFYPAATIPPQYNQVGSACGLLMLWTK